MSLGGEGSWTAQWCSEVRGGREGEWVPCKAGACLVVGLLHCSSPALLLLPNGLSSQIPSPCNRREIIWKGLSFRNDKTTFVINLVEFDTIRSKSKYQLMVSPGERRQVFLHKASKSSCKSFRFLPEKFSFIAIINQSNIQRTGRNSLFVPQRP